jgi:hypothetical protein
MRRRRRRRCRRRRRRRLLCYIKVYGPILNEDVFLSSCEDVLYETFLPIHVICSVPVDLLGISVMSSGSNM